MGSSAFEEAAEVVLEIALKPVPKLCALLAYYPEHLPAHGAGFPTSLNLMVHLAGDRTAPPRFHAYSYPEAAPGFAESDLDEYDKVPAGLAWSRSLGLIRKAFDIDVDLEAIWDNHSRREFNAMLLESLQSCADRLTIGPVEFKAKDATATMTTSQ